MFSRNEIHALTWPRIDVIIQGLVFAGLLCLTGEAGENPARSRHRELIAECGLQIAD